MIHTLGAQTNSTCQQAQYKWRGNKILNLNKRTLDHEKKQKTKDYLQQA